MSVPLSVRTDQSLEDCATCEAASNCLRVMRAGISPTPNNATGPCISAGNLGPVDDDMADGQFGQVHTALAGRALQLGLRIAF